MIKLKIKFFWSFWDFFRLFNQIDKKLKYYYIGEEEEVEDLNEVVETDFFKSIETDQKKEALLEAALCEEEEVEAAQVEQ